MKPLKILLGNNTLSLLAGSETWTYTLALQLKALGHKVQCFTPELGIISDLLKEKGIPSFDQISTSGVKPFSFVFEEQPDHEYDVIIANHWGVVQYLREQFPKTPIISTIHGIIHLTDNKDWAPEHPALESGVNQFVAVSEEVQDLLKNEYGLDSVIIRNFFDTKKFKATRKVSEGKPKVFLINTNYNIKDDPEISIIREVAKHYDAKMIATGENFIKSIDMTTPINDADVVVGMGRSVLEGVTMGRLGLVHGRWGTGGVISKDNIESIRSFNFSGRNSDSTLATPEEIIEQIDKYYTPENLSWGEKYIKKEHNVLFAADAYLNLARELLGQNIVRPEETGLRPYRRQRDVQPTA